MLRTLRKMSIPKLTMRVVRSGPLWQAGLSFGHLSERPHLKLASNRIAGLGMRDAAQLTLLAPVVCLALDCYCQGKRPSTSTLPRTDLRRGPGQVQHNWLLRIRNKPCEVEPQPRICRNLKPPKKSLSPPPPRPPDSPDSTHKTKESNRSGKGPKSPGALP